MNQRKFQSRNQPTKGPSVCASQSYSDRVDVETEQLVVDPDEDPFEEDVSDPSSKRRVLLINLYTSQSLFRTIQVKRRGWS